MVSNVCPFRGCDLEAKRYQAIQRVDPTAFRMAMAIKNRSRIPQRILTSSPNYEEVSLWKLGRFDSTIISDLAIFCCQQKGGSIFFIVQ